MEIYFASFVRSASGRRRPFGPRGGPEDRNLDWFETTEIRGHLAEDGTVLHYQVSLKLGFKMED